MQDPSHDPDIGAPHARADLRRRTKPRHQQSVIEAEVRRLLRRPPPTDIREPTSVVGRAAPTGSPDNATLRRRAASH
jgi:hypothetical protein